MCCMNVFSIYKTEIKILRRKKRIFNDTWNFLSEPHQTFINPIVLGRRLVSTSQLIISSCRFPKHSDKSDRFHTTAVGILFSYRLNALLSLVSLRGRCTVILGVIGSLLVSHFPFSKGYRRCLSVMVCMMKELHLASSKYIRIKVCPLHLDTCKT